MHRRDACRAALLALVTGVSAFARQDDTRTETPAWPAPRTDVFHQSFEWSPDGTRIAFAEFSGGAFSFDKWSVFVADADGSNRRLVVAAARGPSWSPDGTRLAFETREADGPVVWTIGVDGAGRTRVSPAGLAAGDPAWSPDGTRIAFTSKVDDHNTALFTMRTDGSDVRRLTDDPAHDLAPQWSPDGSRVVFYRETGDGRDQVWTIAADGSTETRVTDGLLHNVYPHFASPRSVMYYRTDPATKTASLVERNLDDGSTRVVLEGAGHWARRSPRSGTLAFIAGRWPRSTICRLDETTGEVERVVN